MFCPKFFSQIKILVKKNFQSKIFLVAKKFQSQKNFSHKKVLVTKKPKSQKSFGHKKCQSQ